jgi:branched-chain amino acid transport system permease protein
MKPSAAPIWDIEHMEGFAHQLVAGIATGGIYASVALALVMIYQATHHVNFAQGEMATLSTFIALTMIQAGLPYWVAFFATLVVSFIIGALVERILMRPVQNAPVLTHVGVFIGMLLIISNATGWVFGHTTKAFPTPFQSDGLLFGGLVSAHELGSTAVTLAVEARVRVPELSTPTFPTEVEPMLTVPPRVRVPDEEVRSLVPVPEMFPFQVMLA